MPDTKVCSRCGEEKPLSEFYRRSNRPCGTESRCKICARAKNKRWREVNLAKVKKTNEEWREAHPDYHKQWQRANHDKYNAIMGRYREKHRDTMRAVDHRRRARKLASSEQFTVADIELVRKGQTDKKGKLHCSICGQIKCSRCGKSVEEHEHIDHIIPLSRGGSNNSGNVGISHGCCNNSKHNKLPHEYNGKLF